MRAFKCLAAVLAVCALMMCLLPLSGCNSGADVQIALLTDGGSVRGGDLNQGAWAGVTAASEQFGFTPKSTVSGAATTEEFLLRISNLYEEGYRVFVLPGILFTEALETAQAQYSDCFFIAVDFTPATVASNTVCLTYAEEQAAFLAGFAAAVELREGAFGGIFGMEIPAAQRSSWGFQQGVAYANENYGTSITLAEENFVYAGSFTDSDLGGRLAAEMYDRGACCIFSSFGKTGTGVITEARARTAAGETLWAIGVDGDQSSVGTYQDADTAVLTSAVKSVEESVEAVITQLIEGEFPGGQTLRFDVSNDGVGIPIPEMPEDEDEELSGNLSAETLAAVQEVYERMKAGEITVAVTGEGLIP